MAQQIFVSSSKFSAPVMTLDSSDTQKQGEAAYSRPKNLALTNKLTPVFHVSVFHASVLLLIMNFVIASS